MRATHRRRRLPLRDRARVQALRLTAKTLLGLPPPLLRKLVGPPFVREGLTLDLQVQVLLALAARVRAKETHELPITEGRVEFLLSTAQVAPPDSPHVETEDRIARRGELRVPVRVYRPRGLSPRSPAIVFFHGGGFVVGDLDTHDTVCALLADRARAVVVAVDYRLAPENRFPAAVDDAIAAFSWVQAEASSLGVDPARLAVAGDSAGGNLSAVVAQNARAHDLLPPRAQALIYPATDMLNHAPSRFTFAEGLLLSKAMIDWFKGQYLAEVESAQDPRVSPLLSENLEGQPPALVVTAGFDPLRDEGKSYADRLRAAGVRVEYAQYDSLVHGFVSLAGVVDEARRALDDVGRYLERELHA